VVGSPAIFILLGSSNVLLWLASGVALLIGVLLLWTQWSTPVLLWVVGMNWLPVIADIGLADLGGRNLLETNGGYEAEAVFLSLCSMIALALGMRSGQGIFRDKLCLPEEKLQQISAARALIAYFLCFPLMVGISVLMRLVPSLTQPLLAVGLVKFVIIYVLAAEIFENGQGFGWLIFVLLIETVTGLTGYFADYKEAYFVVFIAMAGSHRRPQIGVTVFGVFSVVIVVWLSLVWTAVKPEYRMWVSGYTAQQVVVRPLDERIVWMSNHIFSKAIDFDATSETLLKRVGYTQFYADILQRLNDKIITDDHSFYVKALVHVFTPRVLFPDKSDLNDSAITTALTGHKIGNNTSMSVGYTAQANVDFGVPGMFLAIFLIGVLLVAIVRYFMTRSCPLRLRQGCATACAFVPFNYGTDIDKALGFLLTGFLALATLMKFGYPLVAQWLGERATIVDRAGVALYSMRYRLDPVADATVRGKAGVQTQRDDPFNEAKAPTHKRRGTTQNRDGLT
jgi:hypothetical protein